MGGPAQEGKGTAPAGAGGFRADLPWLAGLVVVAVALRGWQLTHTEVASRDSIGYIRIAWQLEHSPWPQAMRAAQQHPGYPLALLAVSLPVRAWGTGDLATLMQWSSQLASALASVLLVVPMFYLGRELFNRKVGFWGALLFQCLPASGRGMADGLSEPFFLLGASAALAWACCALRRGSAWAFALSGLAGGLAYLTRPEGGLFVAATGFVLVAKQAVPRWRWPWRRVLVGGAALSLAAAALGIPYALVIGGLTVKPSAIRVIDADSKPQAPGGAGLEPRDLGPAGGPVWAVWWTDGEGSADERAWWGFASFLEVLCKAFFYVFWAPALLGLWWFRDRFRLVPGTWVLVVVCAALTFFLYRVAHVLGYLSDRHTLVLVLCAIYFAAAALDRLGGLLAGVLTRWRPALAGTRWADPRLWSPAVLALCAAGPLPRTLETLHADRVGFRTAGYWLAEHACPGDYVLDPYCWANYYAGRVFTEGLRLPARQPPVFYLVLEQSPNKHTRLREHQAAEVMAQFGKRIQSWEVPRGKLKAEVVVYEMPGPWQPRREPGGRFGGAGLAACR
jgi:hypothetical protein